MSSSSQHSNFSNRLGFIAAAAGSAVGLGNIWKFPYEAGEHGGGIYLMMYIFFTIVLGYPLVVGELTIGRNSPNSLYGAFTHKGRGGKAFALIMAIMALCIYSFYNIITGWLLGYGVEIVRGTLLASNDFKAFFQDFQSSLPKGFLYTLVMMLLIAYINQSKVADGIERWCKVLMPLFFLILIVLVVYVLFLPGALEGLKFFFWPDKAAFSMKGMVSAMSQAFLSLGLGCGIMITYGSYVDKKENLNTSAAAITLSDTVVAIMAGMLIFPLIASQGVSPNEGPALVFISLPGIFQQLGSVAGPLFGFIFFMLLLFAAVTSSMSLLEVPVAYLQQAMGWKRRKSVGVASIVATLLSIPSILGCAGIAPFADLLTLGGKSYDALDFFAMLTLDLGIPTMTFFTSLYILYLNIKARGTQKENKVSFPLSLPFTFVYPVLVGIIVLLNICQKLDLIS